jgi:hypothetical protein
MEEEATQSYTAIKKESNFFFQNANGDKLIRTQKRNFAGRSLQDCYAKSLSIYSIMTIEEDELESQFPEY